VRGPFTPIRTNVTGTMISEHLPLCARIASKYAIVRNHSHTDNGHNTGYHYCMTGYRADFPDGNSRMPNNHLYPSVGSIISRELGPRTTLPPYINMPHIMAGGGAGFYGSEHAPFVIEANPVAADFEVQDLRPLEGMSAARQDRRRECDGRQKRHVREITPEHGPERPPDQERDRRRQDGHAVGDQAGAWCFVHANLQSRCTSLFSAAISLTRSRRRLEPLVLSRSRQGCYESGTAEIY